MNKPTKKEKTRAKPLIPVVQALVDSMKVIYWMQIEAFAHAMVLQALQEMSKEADRDG